MSRRVLSAQCIVLVLVLATCHNPMEFDVAMAAQWAQTFSAGTGNSAFYSVAVEANGNVYAAGCLEGTGTYTFGPGVTAEGPAAATLCW